VYIYYIHISKQYTHHFAICSPQSSPFCHQQSPEQTTNPFLGPPGPGTVDDFRQAHVRELHTALVRQQQVLRFQVAENDPGVELSRN